MRLPFSTLFALSASLFSFVSAIHPRVLSRHGHQRSPASDVLTSRQHRIPRDLLDVCINANVNLLANLSQALGGLLGALGLGGDIQLCLCLKDLTLYLQTNDELQALIGLLGNQEVSAIITALINTSPDSQHCVFPDHAHHTCNNSDPCHYECDEGYELDGNGQCVCASPNISCNSVCGSFPQGCGSAVPRSLKARHDKVRTLAQAKATCKAHESVCGVPGRENTLHFECVDTTVATGSCGGCVTPHPFAVADSAQRTMGSDCDGISNVERSTCSSSRCVVVSCKEGFKPSVNDDGCLPDRALPARMVKLPKRSAPIAVNANATATVGSDLISQLVAIVDMLLGLPSAPPSPYPGSPPAISSSSGPSGYIGAIAPLLNDVRNATDALLKSPTVSALLINIDILLDTLGLLGTATHQCRCEDALGLHGLEQELDHILDAVSHLQQWCAQHPMSPPPAIAPSPPHTSPASGTPSSSSNSNVPATPHGAGTDASSILVGLSDLINHLGLLGPSKAGASVSGLGPGVNNPVNGILTGLGIGPSNFKRRGTILNGNITANATVNAAILLQLDSLVDSVTSLHSLLAALPSTVSGALGPVVETSLVVDLDQAVAQLLQAKDTAGLLDAIQPVITAADNLVDGLTKCGCLQQDVLHQICAYLARLLVAVGSIQDLCTPVPAIPSPSPTTNPAPPSTHPASPSAPATSGISIIVALDHLLSGLGLGGLKADATVSGLGDGLSSTVDNLLNGLGIGPNDLETRQINANATVDADASLLDDLQATGLINALLKLVLGINLPETASSVVDPNLVSSIVNTTSGLPLGPTYADVVSDTAVILAESVILLHALEGCDDLDALGLQGLYSLVIQIVDAALALQSWCHAHPVPSGPTSAPPQPSVPLPVPTTPGPAPPPTNIPAAPSTHPSPPSPPPPPPPPPTMTYPSAPPTNTHASGAPTPSGTDEPIIIGLTKILHDLGLDIDADVVVDGLGNNIDHLVNSITDSLGIGPNGARRRFVRN